MKDREGGLYSVHFTASLDGLDLDDRILDSRLFMADFVLLLPQHTYNDITGEVTHVSSPVKLLDKRQLFKLSTPSTVNVARKLVELEDSKEGNDEHAKEKDSSPLSLGQKPSAASPKMASLFKSGRVTVREGFYRKFNFLESDELF